jgi:hypothetical protein
MFITTEPSIDVSRPALIRLLSYARENSSKTASQEHYTRIYWDGYIRALETVLEMEDE